ncbi:hypothetical protein [Streptomyces sp. NBC_00690]|uniref:hypothetical protein n=1 Tax=Streptomyces sp. NBC_00690 TaxID=2975808 RepID=UPI002E2B17AF|nr:hypothetical protein [Streptomyces sp. NBC_00690]
MRTRLRSLRRLSPSPRKLAFAGVLTTGAVLLLLDVPSDWFTVIGLALAYVTPQPSAQGRTRSTGRKRSRNQRRNTH